MSETKAVGPDDGDTRARILRAADERFTARGYHATSVREIADLVGVTKAAVLYHFPEKADILGALAQPMLDDLEAALDGAAGAAPERVPWAAVEAMLDVWLRHRDLLRLNLQDLALAAPSLVFDRFKSAMLRANALVAGPDPDFAGQVRAAQTIAVLGDPVVLFADAPVAELRAEVLSGVHRLLGADAPRPASPSRGRPALMDDAMTERARSLHASGRGAAEIARELGVSRATVYRRLGLSQKD
ncbi:MULTISPECIES: TetR family transcriptional regulator [Streptomyces]|uniref:TetR family transcriptional regulator n=1 Tax=Streptomyces solicathayae TaxID=3081768 RepID=A0ABZ0M3W7_9ACTN|nr:TetR family transcriptional regulator [Streptomyces sp. HUAS YS2]WOX26195.1 TetR family transcriptional regulator [Streptomyces sp. HUAS YS2]